MGHSIRVFHSADWHFGKMQGQLDRTADFEAFLTTFFQLVDERQPDVLLLSGDIFDTSLPSATAQRLYYQFIHRLRETSIRATVITAGNHDSQRFLEAPKALLATLNCFIAGDTPEEEAFIYRDKEGTPLLGVAAVPYLREGDVREAHLSDTDADRAQRFEAGVLARYQAVYDELKRELDGRDVPLIAMGHLFVVGADVRPGEPLSLDSRTLNVGSLNAVSAHAFGSWWDYVALGHIHHASRVQSDVPMRYSGSPIALTFNHRFYEHSLTELTFSEDGVLTIETLPVAQPRAFVHLEGTLEELVEGIREAGRSYKEPQPPYIEALLNSQEVVPDLAAYLGQVAQEAGIILVAVRNAWALKQYREQEAVLVDLSDLTPQEVFRLYLEDKVGLEEAQTLRETYLPLYQQALLAVDSQQDPDSEVR